MVKTKYLRETEKLCDVTPGEGTGRSVIHFFLFKHDGSAKTLNDLFQKGASVLKTMRLGKKQEVKADGAGWFEVKIAGTDERRILMGVHFHGTNGANFQKHLQTLKELGVPLPDDTICGDLPRTFFYPMKTFYGKIAGRPSKNAPSEERLEELLSMTEEEVRALPKGELTYLCLHYHKQHQQQQQEESDGDEESDGKESAGESEEEFEECDEESDGGESGHESPPKKARINADDMVGLRPLSSAQAPPCIEDDEQKQQQLFDKMRALQPYMDTQDHVLSRLRFDLPDLEKKTFFLSGHRVWYELDDGFRTPFKGSVPIDLMHTVQRLAKFHKSELQGYIDSMETAGWTVPEGMDFSRDYFAEFYALKPLFKGFDAPLMMRTLIELYQISYVSLILCNILFRLLVYDHRTSFELLHMFRVHGSSDTLS